ncbi:MAG: hypothetical protein WD232_08405 [Acidimicrobiales bacterium]
MADRTPALRQVPALPQCCVHHRLAALDVVETMFVNDTLANYDRMLDPVGGAWPADAAVAALRTTYKPWILGHIGDAIDLAIDLLDQEVAA